MKSGPERAPSQASASAAAGAAEFEEWEQLVGGMVRIPGLLREFGVDTAALLARAGLSADVLDRSTNRAPFHALARLLAEAVSETDCPHFGLLVGAAYQWSDVGPPGELALACATVREALETFTVYQRLNSQGGAVYFKRYGETAEVGFAVFHPHVAARAPAHDLAVASLVSGVRLLCGPAWHPTGVLLPRAHPGDDQPYRAHFRCPVRFDADRAAFSFDAAVLLQPLPTANPVRKRALEAALTAALRDDLMVRLYRALRLLLLDGNVGAAFLAQHFAMHQRTLQRHLKAHGITFQAVLDEVRYEAARQLLSETALPASAVAAAVGYAEPASFTHAFRRWSGHTPAQWRAAHRVAGAPVGTEDRRDSAQARAPA